VCGLTESKPASAFTLFEDSRAGRPRGGGQVCMPAVGVGATPAGVTHQVVHAESDEAFRPDTDLLQNLAGGSRSSLFAHIDVARWHSESERKARTPEKQEPALRFTYEHPGTLMPVLASSIDPPSDRGVYVDDPRTQHTACLALEERLPEHLRVARGFRTAGTAVPVVPAVLRPAREDPHIFRLSHPGGQIADLKGRRKRVHLPFQSMSQSTIKLGEIKLGELMEYVVAQGSTPDEVTLKLIRETRATLGDRAGMLIPPIEAALMTFLTRLINARQAIEIGTFTGYSSIAIARGLGPGGKLLCCDVSEDWTAIAQRYWQRAGVHDLIELRLAPAAETLRALPRRPHFDLAFIDADKTGYCTYWEELVMRMRPGGLLVADNVLRDGRVVAPISGDRDTLAICEFNEKVLADNRVDSVMLPIADGITLARKR
jgi:predicted O-methyltransferase YrrM